MELRILHRSEGDLRFDEVSARDYPVHGIAEDKRHRIRQEKYKAKAPIQRRGVCPAVVPKGNCQNECDLKADEIDHNKVKML